LKARRGPGARLPAFSIIVPVYNGSTFIDECFDSVFRQRFRGSFEIIAVDDGSGDGSWDILDRWAGAHPGKIKPIRQANSGPSAARNAGASLAKGEYVLFLDVDDRLGRGALKRVLAFFGRHGPEIDIVTLPINRFEGRTGGHPLNDKFRKGSRIIDAALEPNLVLRHTTSSFVRRTALPANPFDESVHYGEDALLMLQLLIRNPKFGVIDGARLWKRSRRDRSSLVDRLYDRPENLEQIVGWHERLTHMCLLETGTVPPYVQASILYDYQWQCRASSFGYALENDKRRESYLRRAGAILSLIDIRHFEAARFVGPAERSLLYAMKHGPAAGMQLFPANWELPPVEILFVESGSGVTVEGRVFSDRLERLVAKANGEEVEVKPNPSTNGTALFFGERVRCFQGFSLTLPSGNTKIEFALRCESGIIPLKLAYGRHSGLSVRGAGAFGIIDRTAFFGQAACLHIKVVTSFESIGLQAGYLAHLLSRMRLRQFLLRSFGLLAPKSREKRYLLIDRINSADDNAEHLFRHMEKNPRAGLLASFCVARDSPDWKRLSPHKPVAYGSLRHKLETFRAHAVVSSHANDTTFHPFGRDERFLRDLLRAHRIFVPHGVMNTSRSYWCSREETNIRLFTTTAQDEHEMMRAGEIGYTDRELRLTGMPRYDGLQPEPPRQLVLMPTWRMGLVDELGAMPERQRLRGFEESAFVTEWRAVRKSLSIQQCAQKHELGIALVWHPRFFEVFRSWGLGTDEIREALGEEVKDFRKLKATCAALITDYSSISFDIAYLRRPVAYYQFDRKRILTDPAYHRYAPDFDFANRGLGPVFLARDELAGWVDDMERNGLHMRQPYASRADNFFAFHDRENCRRVWQEIAAL
jgi:glycosyltransferase involved in cell wall biosynthesis